MRQGHFGGLKSDESEKETREESKAESRTRKAIGTSSSEIAPTTVRVKDTQMVEDYQKKSLIPIHIWFFECRNFFGFRK